ICLSLRLNRDCDDRLRELNRLENNCIIFRTKGIASGRILEPYCGCDVACIYLFDLFALIGMHLQNTANTLLLLLSRIVDIGSRVEHARINTEEAKLTNEGVSHNLESQRRKGFCIRSVTLDLIPADIYTLNGRDVHRRGQVGYNGIKKILNAFILKG